MKFPKDTKITGRSSTIRGSFIKAIIPTIPATDKEKENHLKILGQINGKLHCSYCGIPATESDHFRPVVVKKRPSGYVTDIFNLVPACGKCNQSKSGTYWKTWIINKKAKFSPINQLVSTDLKKRILVLEKFEKWSDKYVTKMPIEFLEGKEFSDYLKSCEKLIVTLKKYQIKAEEIKTELQKYKNKNIFITKINL
jgi:5-methylcytosine-specific restriction endonuclease McrA